MIVVLFKIVEICNPANLNGSYVSGYATKLCVNDLGIFKGMLSFTHETWLIHGYLCQSNATMN